MVAGRAEQGEGKGAKLLLFTSCSANSQSCSCCLAANARSKGGFDNDAITALATREQPAQIGPGASRDPKSQGGASEQKKVQASSRLLLDFKKTNKI